MTSNQIAAKAELESERHNIATETETNRHNLAMEAVSDEQNQIQASYNSQYLKLQDEINANRLAYEYATLDEKKWYDEEYVRLQDEIHELDDWYKTKMVSIEQDKYSESKRHNEQAEALGWYNAGIADKQAEYQKHQWDEQNTIKWAEYGLERSKLIRQQNYDSFIMASELFEKEKDLANLKLREAELTLAQKEYALEDWKAHKEFEFEQKNYALKQKQTKANITQGYMHAASELIHNNNERARIGVQLLDSFIPN